MRRKIAQYHSMKGGMLDNDYYVYDDGAIIHFYDRNQYPGNQNIEEEVSAEKVSDNIKKDLLASAKKEDKELVKEILKM